MNDPFWKRSGFWTALTATVPLCFSVAAGNVTQEIVIAVVGAWGTFLTVAVARPTQRGD